MARCSSFPGELWRHPNQCYAVLLANPVVTHFSARLLLKITDAQLELRFGSATGVEAARSWQTILLEADEVISVLQRWKPAYFDTADPMSAYIAYIAACVLVLNSKATGNTFASESSEHVDLSMLFLSRIGRFWPIGTYGSNCELAPLLSLEPARMNC